MFPAAVVRHAFALCLLLGLTAGQNWTAVNSLGPSAVNPAVKGVAMVVSGTDHLLVGITPTQMLIHFNDTTQQWEQTESASKLKVTFLTSCADGTVWLLDTAGKVYRQHLTFPPLVEIPTVPNKTFSQLAGKDKDIASAVATTGEVYRYKDGNWTQLPGNITAKQLAMGSDGVILALDDQGRLMEHIADDWVEMMGGMNGTGFDVYNRAGNRIVITNQDHEVLMYADDLWLPIESPVPSGCKDVSISLNEVFCVTADFQVYRIKT
ncbi:hypothetical protein BV898_08586 [Hypsibius exemplaris]|uniref:Bulb-type lectin domain-containing protein n=1 Tax=Hypsibius exemplaris TaxID=2072580 RepID=A0A1W0WQB6_HYPEX|nr:hypothetical protein BV898_08586 [Hypsibius exemplaris]